MAVNCFKQILYSEGVIALEHDILGISEVGNMRVGSILNPGGILQGFTKNTVDGIVEESRVIVHILAERQSE